MEVVRLQGLCGVSEYAAAVVRVVFAGEEIGVPSNLHGQVQCDLISPKETRALGLSAVSQDFRERTLLCKNILQVFADLEMDVLAKRGEIVERRP